MSQPPYPHNSYQSPPPPIPPQSYTTSPPPPPPKTGPQSPAYSGPPLPPHPSQQQSYPPPQHQYQQQQQHLASPPPLPSNQNPHQLPQQPSSLNPPSPAIEEYWLPEILQDKSKPDLASLLQSASLLSALTTAPSTTHPSIPSSQIPLSQSLTTNATLATNLNTLSAELASLRQTLTQRLLSLHALERQWRHKQVEMDTALEPWSPKALHGRLVASIGEQEMLCRALEESFLESSEGGKASEREVAEWVRRYKEGRVVLGLRRERRARFEEGRVGGWR